MDITDEELDINKEWEVLLDKINKELSKRPKDMNAVLYLIGVQELGAGARLFTKEEKQDLIHIAICKVLSYSGFYTLEGIDGEGWPHWKRVKKLPAFDLMEQESLLKSHILEYFKKEVGW